MKKLQFLLLICILTFTISCGQQKRYVSYKVQKGETMRDIAKRLNMKTRDLLRLNPDVDRKPTANTVIVIPNTETKKVISSSTKNSKNTDAQKVSTDTNEKQVNPLKEKVTETPDTSKLVYQQTVYEYQTHTVKASETVYRITKKYNISKDDLIKWNPDFPEISNNTISIGQILKVKPIAKTIAVDKETILKNFLTHTVKTKETVYSLTRFYNISKDALIQLNPEYPALKNNELSTGQLLKIKPIEAVNSSDNYAFYKDNIKEDIAINLAILLPFRAKEYSNMTAVDIFSQKKNSSAKLANMVTDFYLGAEMAVDSIKKQHITVNLNLFDTGNRGKNIASILAKNSLENTDVVIGPFYSDKAEIVASKVKSPVIFPHFSSNQDKFSGSKLVKTAPDKNSYTDYLISYLKETYNGEQIFVVGDGKTASNSKINKIVSQLKTHDSITNIHVLKPTKGYIKRALFTRKMTSKKRNWVLITSDDNVAIADVLNSMIGVPDNIKLQVFAIEKHNAYEKLENNKLASVNFTYVSDSYTDDSSKDVTIFNKKYYKKNNTIPSDYAIKGFDITYDVLMRLASGKALTNTFKEGVSLRLENKFDYHKKMFGSTSNKGLFMVKYNKDLSLTRLK
ncbi:LysM peptidoglycan-binding domain-containing protein [Tenacibaculum piscium]|uniref:LysM peptidoglycan-binding domain-containing protein n=1 Tax=Tenacibaculum piscium TaxID=1458515 RepID=UPI001F2C6610|nr:LysM peptidoglycan-binding domain-containing protein [Tenacibaculum piscium]